jgi:hypothetical protein
MALVADKGLKDVGVLRTGVVEATTGTEPVTLPPTMLTGGTTIVIGLAFQLNVTLLL